MTIFEKIVRREIPADIVWEDDDVLAFRDVNPQAPVHVLIVPKRVIARLADATSADEALLGKLLLASRKVAEKLDLLTSGYRVVINSGPDAGESVPHLHVHVLGKRALAWPPGQLQQGSAIPGYNAVISEQEREQKMAPVGDGWIEPDASSWKGLEAALPLRVRAPVNEREPAKEREDQAGEWASERGRASGKGWERVNEREQESGLERWSERQLSEPEAASREPQDWETEPAGDWSQ